ncbi:MAG: endonuclease/exonuclease/phosphatase family protein [Alphaproteobacteria bacterium]|nr:endonuclease/exonuclease/phosphatase family protein [Alphaproteobacteria bacterium SS10]
MTVKGSYRPFIQKLAQLSLAILLLPSLLALGEAQFWLLELAAHFRLQAVLAAIVLALIFGPLKAWRSLVVALCLITLNGWFVGHAHMTSQPLAEPQADAQTLRVLQFNMNLFHPDPDGLATSLLETDADLIVLQELSPDAATRISAALADDYQHQLTLPQTNAFGMGVFSRFEITELQRLSATSLDAVSVRLSINTARHGDISLAAIHPPPPITRQLAALRNEEIGLAADWLAGRDGPKLLMGDLNLTPYSIWFRELVRQSGLQPVQKLLPFSNVTWPDRMIHWLFSIPIDHVMISEDLEFVSWRAEYGHGSDHAMIVADLQLATP